jgi:hypothetical protein
MSEWSVRMTDNQGVTGFILSTSILEIFLTGLGLEQGPVSLVRTAG